MKTTLLIPPPIPKKPTKQDPFQRVFSAVKKLDQLINRAHQLGTLTNQLLREDKTGPSLPSSESDATQPVPSRSSTKSNASRKVWEK